MACQPLRINTCQIIRYLVFSCYDDDHGDNDADDADGDEDNEDDEDIDDDDDADDDADDDDAVANHC